MSSNIVVTTSAEINRTKGPALPSAPVAYDRGYHDANNNILRQYFNTLDNFVSQLSVATDGGGLPKIPHIAAQNNTDQYTTTNTATKVLWGTLDSGFGFTLNSDSTATPTYAGIYKIDYSLQFVNTDSQVHDVFVWLQVDGVNTPGSASQFSVPNKHGSVNGTLVAYSSVTFLMAAGSKVALYWATNSAATSGGTAGVYMLADPAQTSPFSMPSVPSAIGSIVLVSGPV
jgi:hypothetical protein